MGSWIETAREAVRRSKMVRDELRDEAKSMLVNGEPAAAKRIFEDILDEPLPEAVRPVDAPIESAPAGTWPAPGREFRSIGAD